MGTRGFMGWAVDGHLYGSYNHFDSYPTGLGKGMGEAIEVMLKTGLEHYRTLARSMRKVKEGDKPTEEDRKKYGHLWQDVSDGADWYSFLRANQGGLVETLESGIYHDGIDFPKDSLWCEWAYVADFDRQILEVYEGFTTNIPSAGRW